MYKHVSHLDICLKNNLLYFFIFFFGILFTLPSTQTIKAIVIIYFQWAGLEKLGYEHAF